MRPAPRGSHPSGGTRPRPSAAQDRLGSASDERAAGVQRLMDELPEFCARVLGRGEGAMQAAVEARDRASACDRVALLAAAVAACRALELAQVPVADPTAEPLELAPVPVADPPAEPLELAPVPGALPTVEPLELAPAVAVVLAVANAELPQRQREA